MVAVAPDFEISHQQIITMTSPAGGDRPIGTQNEGMSDQTTRRRESFASQESQTAKEYEAIRASLSI